MKSQELITANPPFPVYKDRAAYKAATGQEAPPYTPDRPIKRWFDPNAGADGLPEVIYPNNVMVYSDGTFVLKNGVPMTRPLVMSVEEAKTVNLPPEDPSGRTVVPANAKEVAGPFRDLGPDEILVVAGKESGFLSGKVIMIRNVPLFNEEQAKVTEEEGKFTGEDRRLLKAIAEKLGAV